MIKLGTNSIGKVYLGSNLIGKAYLGSNLVYTSGGAPVIPDGPVDWIETDGVAYINTGIAASFPLACDFEAVFVGNGTMLGARVANGDRAEFMTYSNRVDFAYGSGYYNGNDISTSITNGTPVFVKGLLKHRNTGSYVATKQSGESSYTTKSTNNFPTIDGVNYSLFLFAKNDGGTVASKQPSGTRLYYCKIYSDTSFSNLVFDGVPYRHHGKYGLWDNVSNTFFGNTAGSGSFTGAELPYTPVDYIETDGTAYIDTGIKGNSAKSSEVKLLPKVSTTFVTYLGSRLSNTRFLLLCQWGSAGGYAYDNYMAYGYENGSNPGVAITASLNNSTPLEAKSVLQNGTQKVGVKQQGESVFTEATGTNNNNVTTGLNIFVFASNQDGAAQQKAASGSRIYYCKIYSKEDYTDLIFDGIPCIYNGEYGLWDNITNSFFGNIAESGAFSGPSNS